MSPYRQRTVILYFLVLFVLILYFLFRIFQPFLNTLLISLILAGLFYPVFRWLEKALKGRRTLASLNTCLLIFLTVFIPLLYFVAALGNETLSLYTSLSEKVAEGKLLLFWEQHQDDWSQLLERFSTLNLPIRAEELEQDVVELGKKILFTVYEQARIFIANFAKFFLHFLFLLVILFYLFLDGARLRRFIFSLSPLPEHQEQFLVEKFNGMARAVLLINGLAGILQGVLGGLGFWAFGLPSPFLYGSLMAILAFLPIVGISIVYIPASIYLFFMKKYLAGAIFVLCFALLSFVVEYVMKPRMVGQQAKMHTLLTFLSIIGGLSTFGVLGILYGPLIMTAFLSLAELYKQTYEKVLLGQEDNVSAGPGIPQ